MKFRYLPVIPSTSQPPPHLTGSGRSNFLPILLVAVGVVALLPIQAQAAPGGTAETLNPCVFKPPGVPS